MQNFFDQVKTILAENITSFYSKSGMVDIELKYRDLKMEIDYDPISGGSMKAAEMGEILGETLAPTFELSLVTKSGLELEILPSSSFDRLFDIEAGVSLFAKKIKIKSPLIENELVVHTNNEALARSFLGLTNVSKIVKDYGVTFFKIEGGEIIVSLDQLTSKKFEELKSNPRLIVGYLDIITDLSIPLKQ